MQGDLWAPSMAAKGLPNLCGLHDRDQVAQTEVWSQTPEMIEGQRNDHGVSGAVLQPRLLKYESWNSGPWPLSTSFS